MTGKVRPGGRTARTKEAVFEAAAALIAERGYDAITMTDIAERAGVAATSLYRRWGDVRVLVLEVAVEELMRERPLPDTGSLRGDLSAWGRSIAAGLSSNEGSSFFRALVATMMPAGTDESARSAALTPRSKQISTMMARARERGEKTPPVSEVLDHLLAPLYVRALFGAPADEAFAEKLVERLLTR
jgi:AcrR family transcriptional regulator